MTEINKCNHVKQYCEQYIKGDIAHNLVADIEAHISQCDTCRHFVEQQREITNLITSQSEIPEYSSISSDVMKKIDLSNTVSSTWYLSAAMTCIILVMLTVSYWGNRPTMVEEQLSSADIIEEEVLEPGILLSAPLNETENIDDEFGDI